MFFLNSHMILFLPPQAAQAKVYMTLLTDISAQN